MRLYVNIDHVATVREARRTDEPDPVRAAAAAEQGGADGITVHLREDRRNIRAAIERLTAAGIRVSLFIDPDPATIDRAAALGVPAVELHTGRYARSWRKSDAALRTLARAAAHARGRGLAVHAGHGLTYDNVRPVAAIRDVEELNIGHSIVSNAIFLGIEAAVRRMRQLVDEGAKP